jgi:ribonuclease VapC
MTRSQAVVLDTTAILALRGDEDGADHVEHILASAKRKRVRVLVSFMSRMEILYLVRREEDENAAIEAIRLLDSFPIQWVSCEPAILDKAAELKSVGGLSVADSWIAATAILRDARLVHRDPEFAAHPELSQEWLGAS